MPAAGSGERLGAGGPKALVECAGKPLLAWCLIAFEASKTVGAVVIAAPDDGAARDAVVALAKEHTPGLDVTVVAGGASRSESVRNALAAAGTCDVVVVHDAARPMVTAKLIDRCVGRLSDGDDQGVIAANPVADTVKQADPQGRVTQTLDRSSLWAVQTPQVFRTDALGLAFDQPESMLAEASDDAALVERAGGVVRILRSDPQNFKVTTAFDLAVAAELLRR